MTSSYTLRDVRASYSAQKAWEEMSGDLPVYLVHRPLSFPLTTLLLRLSVPTTAVTLVTGVLVLTIPIVAARSDPWGFAYLAGLGFAFDVLDCVDGNLARTRGVTSRLGAWLDGLFDQAFWVAFFVSTGWLSDQVGPTTRGGLDLGLATALMFLFARWARDLARSLTARRVEQEMVRPVRIGVLGWGMIALSGLEHLFAPALLAAGFLGAISELCWFMAAYAAVVLTASLLLSVRALAAAPDS